MVFVLILVISKSGTVHQMMIAKNGGIICVKKLKRRTFNVSW